eukprot:364314-Chlamydomonas_euryale.AAC.5
MASPAAHHPHQGVPGREGGRIGRRYKNQRAGSGGETGIKGVQASAFAPSGWGCGAGILPVAHMISTREKGAGSGPVLHLKHLLYAANGTDSHGCP